MTGKTPAINRGPIEPTGNAKSNRPATTGEKACAECTEPFTPSRPNEHFCHDRCRRAWHNLQLKRGKQAMLLLHAWRRKRQGHAFTKLSRLLSHWLCEDKKAGRLSELPGQELPIVPQVFDD